jgi:hypothetical protein
LIGLGIQLCITENLIPTLHRRVGWSQHSLRFEELMQKSRRRHGIDGDPSLFDEYVLHACLIVALAPIKARPA